MADIQYIHKHNCEMTENDLNTKVINVTKMD